MAWFCDTSSADIPAPISYPLGSFQQPSCMTLIAVPLLSCSSRTTNSVEVYILCLVISDNPYTFLTSWKQNKGPFHLGRFHVEFQNILRQCTVLWRRLNNYFIINPVFDKTVITPTNVDNVFIAFSIDIPFAVLSHYPLSSYTAGNWR
jgi:hypothetical protein